MKSSVNEYLIGGGHKKNGTLIGSPMNFSNKNFMNLLDQHNFFDKTYISGKFSI